jgi:hypothetical protein
VGDGLHRRRMVHILSVVDAYTRECLALEADEWNQKFLFSRILPTDRIT